MNGSREEQERDQQERLRQQQVKDAFALFKRHPKFPGVFVQIGDKGSELERVTPLAEMERLSEPRLEYFLKYLDIQGAGYLQLVDDLKLQEALEAIMDDFVRIAWFQVSGMPLDAVPFPLPFATPHPVQVHLKRLMQRAIHWRMEGYRRLDSLGKETPKPDAETAHYPKTRVGYRSEVRAWMEGKFSSVKAAATNLGVSESVLKSIMASKGKVKYSRETLDSVLKKILRKSGDQSGDHS
jgi:hypothetical protein